MKFYNYSYKGSCKRGGFLENLICAKCNEQIEKEDLVECPHCWEIYHRECWEHTTNCLSCNKFNIDSIREDIDEEDNEKPELNLEQTVDEAENESDFDDAPMGKEPRFSNIANTIMTVSNVVLIIGIVMGIIIAVYGIFAIKGLIGGVVGVGSGVVIAAIGWVASVLVNGFAELINNSQKNAYYLSQLVESREEKEE